MESLCGVKLYGIPLKVFILEIGLHHLLLLLIPLKLKGVIRQQHLLIVLDQEPTERAAPLDHFFLGLEEDDVEGVLSDGVLAHRSEHLESPWELLSITHIERAILLEMLVEGIENCFEVHNFIRV